ncbi:hypothetical protein A1sIA79_00660 [Candidatus Planktophila versatilis]|uniref:Uncharacterized protein n=1 Tax=Candidatus Planktophila versatilis TaxID=1884905 RepID=A0ABM6MD17_9ACTN|nr:hypothetical protein A1sIA79_00660 [Candidatus Planktophila versatilis]
MKSENLDESHQVYSSVRDLLAIWLWRIFLIPVWIGAIGSFFVGSLISSLGSLLFATLITGFIYLHTSRKFEK